MDVGCQLRDFVPNAIAVPLHIIHSRWLFIHGCPRWHGLGAVLAVPPRGPVFRRPELGAGNVTVLVAPCAFDFFIKKTKLQKGPFRLVTVSAQAG